MQAIISLTTDYGIKDHYVAAFKAKLMQRFGNIPVLDISHSVSPYNIIEAALFVKSIKKHCLENTIHLIDVDHAGGNMQLIWIQRDNQYFVMPDNGMISLIFPDCYKYPVFKLPYAEEDLRFLNMQDLFIHVADRLINEANIGSESTNYMQSQTFNPIITGDTVHVSVIYVDQYSNAILNIDFEQFEKFRNGRRFEISIQRQFTVNRISASYAQVHENELCCIVNDAGHLELCMNKAKLAQLFSLGFGSEMLIDFQ
ncbi:MAG: SAM-dependent chlorinase/fluorinase [Bacteroidetes bacterium]|nr:SAM-dependent chlorinase/fluorinase [Bacteroidota bacterium]